MNPHGSNATLVGFELFSSILKQVLKVKEVQDISVKQDVLNI